MLSLFICFVGALGLSAIFMLAIVAFDLLCEGKYLRAAIVAAAAGELFSFTLSTAHQLAVMWK